jgi:DNA-binding transcriptional LysR family regulator
MRSPSLEQLRVFVAVAETGTFSAAARRLARAQPAVSQSIQATEALLNVALFDRRGTQVVLTIVGRGLIELARAAVAAADAVRDAADRLSSELESELSIAVDGSVPKSLLAQSLNAVGAAFPDLPIAVFNEPLGGAEQMLREQLAHIAVYAPATASRFEEMNGERLTTLPIVLVAAADHPLAALPAPLALAQLDGHVQLVLRDRNRAMAPISGSILSTRTWAFSDFEMRLAALLAGSGWAHMPLYAVEEALAVGHLALLEVTNTDPRFRHMDLCIVHQLGNPLGRAGRFFAEDLKRRFADSTGEQA